MTQFVNPLLSIIIPSYNYARYLPFALDSVLAQDFHDYEIILIDDGSTDESHSISERYAAKDPRIRYKRYEENRGLFSRFEEGIHLARGKYVHSLGADDLYLPGFLTKSMNLLIQNPQIGLVSSDIAYFQDGSNTLDVRPLLKQCQSPCVYFHHELIKVFQETDFWIAGATSIAKKELVIKYGGYSPILENISDWYLFHQIALFEGMAYLPENLLAMRVHSQTYTQTVKRDKKRRRATYWALLKLLDRNKEVREKFKKSALLTFIFNDLKWKVRLNPKYWDFLPYIYKKNRFKL